MLYTILSLMCSKSMHEKTYGALIFLSYSRYYINETRHLESIIQLHVALRII